MASQRVVIAFRQPTPEDLATSKGLSSTELIEKWANDLETDLGEFPLTPLFRGERGGTDWTHDSPPPGNFYWAEIPSEAVETAFQTIRATLVDHGIYQAYVEPPARLAFPEVIDPSDIDIVLGRGRGLPGKMPTPDFSPRQGWRSTAAGVWTHDWLGNPLGHTGADIQVCDVEVDVRVQHEALSSSSNYPKELAPATEDDIYAQCHGTAVAGVICGQLQRSGVPGASGVRGIAPGSQLIVCRTSVASVTPGTPPIASAIYLSIPYLAKGSVLLIEAERRGPLAVEPGVNIQTSMLNPPSLAEEDMPASEEMPSVGSWSRYLPVEYLPADFTAILAATDRGIIVVEAAGNGGENLDDEFYDSPPPPEWGYPFVGTWANPFRRASTYDSGAILVGAGAPPRGMAGRDWGAYRSRLPHSNYGSCVDVQGWGRGIVTAGYGDLQGGVDPDRWYTDRFGGTSGAAAMVAGMVAVFQSARAPKQPLTWKAMRKFLSANGKPQTGNTAKHIGPMPHFDDLQSTDFLKLP